jgi:hypothetical protein
MSSSIPARPTPPRAAAHDHAGGEDVAHGARSARSGKRDNRAREAPAAGAWSWKGPPTLAGYTRATRLERPCSFSVSTNVSVI